MKYGCFGRFKDLPVIESVGFSSVEADFQDLTNLTDTEFDSLMEYRKSSSLTFTVFSGLLPLTLRFFDNYDEEFWLAKIRKGAARASLLGCKMIPFGAGKCRSLPPSVERLDGAKHVALIVSHICDVLSENGISLVVEPLGPHYSNFLHTLPEVSDFLELVDRTNCLSMCDLRHMIHAGEPLKDILTYRDIIRHAHIDYPLGEHRYFPARNDGYDYSLYLDMLRRSGYEGLLTIEATAIQQDFRKEAAEGLAVISAI